MSHTFVLSRRVGRPLVLAERTLVGLPSGEYDGLTLLGFFERRTMVGPWGSGPPERDAPADLRVGRRTERVMVELGPWSQDAVELRVRPCTRRPQRWRGRRQARYFAAAHAAIDALARTLEHETPALPAGLPETRTA
jgi:hypothetical protein